MKFLRDTNYQIYMGKICVKELDFVVKTVTRLYDSYSYILETF